MKNILIALDYNPTAQKVAETGFSIAENKGMEITLLHVIADPSFYGSSVYDPVMGFGGYTSLDLLAPDILDELKRTSLIFLDKSRQHLGNTDIKILAREGTVAETILQVAKEINADLIVIGSHSKRWLENILMGSIIEHVLHHTTLPLLIVPTKK